MRIILVVLTAVFVLFGCTTKEQLPTYTISGKILNQVDDRLFSGFFEKATWGGEIGCDAAISLKTGEVFPEVKEYIEWMNIPILRYPGGTAIDYYPWYFLIDSMPGKHNTRPENLNYRNLDYEDACSSDGRMGLHEFIELCQELEIEPLLVTNLGDAFYKKLSIAQAAEELGANFVSYCNDKKGKWAELRKANGNAEPFNVKYFQIGNESWIFDNFHKKDRKAEDLEHYAKCVEAYIRAMKKADPSIEIIIDGVEGINQKVMEKCGELVSFNVFHSYSPWGISEIKRGDQKVAADSVKESEVWQGLASAPLIDSITGLSVIRDWVLDSIDTPIALTEWNLNTWFTGEAKKAQPYNQLLAYGIGAGSYLHAILRVSDQVKMANQSMLAGTSWLITGIRIDTTEKVLPKMYPTAMITGLYSRNHGNELLELKSENIHFYQQPLTLNNIKPAMKVAEQDVVVTADSEYYYIHVVNRSFDHDREILLVFPEKVQSQYVHYLLSDRTQGDMSDFANIEKIELENGSQKTKLMIPSKSVSVFKFKKG